MAKEKKITPFIFDDEITEDMCEKIDFRKYVEWAGHEIGDWYRYLFKFDNHWGAYVVKNSTGMTRGGKEDLWELYLVRFDEEIDYKWEFREENYGYLSNSAALSKLKEIKNM